MHGLSDSKRRPDWQFKLLLPKSMPSKTIQQSFKCRDLDVVKTGITKHQRSLIVKCGLCSEALSLKAESEAVLAEEHHCCFENVRILKFSGTGKNSILTSEFRYKNCEVSPNLPTVFNLPHTANTMNVVLVGICCRFW